MSKKESEDYFRKLMNDTQDKINSIDSNHSSLKSELIKSSNKNEKSSNEDVKIDKSKQNLEQNMSDNEPKKSKIAIATLKMPDGKESRDTPTA